MKEVIKLVKWDSTILKNCDGGLFVPKIQKIRAIVTCNVDKLKKIIMKGVSINH